MDTIRIRLFNAPKELHTCYVYMQHHKQVLADFGIEMITSNNQEWVYNPNTHVVVAESMKTGEMIAGIRVQLYGGKHTLPIQEATGAMDPKIHTLLKEENAKGQTGEVCGLWNSRKYKGIGISSILLNISTAILSQFNVSSFFGLCDSSSLDKMKLQGGYSVEKSVGNEGAFFYPKLNLLAYAIILKDPNTVKLAETSVRNLIFSLREQPQQNGKLSKNGVTTHRIAYQLLSDNHSNTSHYGKNN